MANDYRTLALRSVRAAGKATTSADAQVHATVAAAYASLAIAEEQHAANLLALVPYSRSSSEADELVDAARERVGEK